MTRPFWLMLGFFLSIHHAGQPAFGQGTSESPSLSQSSPAIQWRIINTPFVRVIYPSNLEQTGNQVANLIDHYSKTVGQSYGIDAPRQFTLVLRPETAEPNGFVTLAPRRSEWFLNKAVTPLVGGLEFTQALAIHEYRHVNQFDYLNQRFTKFIYFLFGETGQAIATNIGVPDWFYEGDAVWAETTNTDGGRGRSPRFSERLKAMLTSQQIPSYDQMISGTYKTAWPNHYVYGYFLVTRAYRLYGKDVWRRVLSETASFALNPYLFYSSFKEVTNQSFDDYYDETMKELADAWKKDDKLIPSTPPAQYTSYQYPITDIDGSTKDYYLKQTLDTYLGLYERQASGERLVHEFNIQTQLSRIDVKHGLVAYVQGLPDPRYQYREYSDLFIYDLASDQTTQITQNKRYYQPQISPDGKSILVIDYGQNNQWRLTVVDLNGKALQETAFASKVIDEAVWQDQQTLVAIMEDEEGYKSIVRIKLGGAESSNSQNSAYKTLLGRTRNNLYSLNLDGESVYFEADFKGTVQIFKLSMSSGQLSQCTQEAIAAHQPFVHAGRLDYVSVVASGSKINRQSAQCTSVAVNALAPFHYLGQGPSDNFTATKPVTIANYPAMIAESHPSEDYSQLDGGLKPHSWSFFGGRGLALSGNATNYLNTLNLNASVGLDSEEKRPFQRISLEFMKYYPVFSLTGNNRERSTTNSDTKERLNWRESSVFFGTKIPYIYTRGMYDGMHQLSFDLGYQATTQHPNAARADINGDQIVVTAVGYNFSYLKKKRYREIFNPWGLTLYGVYENDQAQKNRNFSSWIHYAEGTFYAPGVFTNHGMKFTVNDQRRAYGADKYQRISYADAVNQYVFSRGYESYVATHYTKGSYDYVMPLIYPDANADGWIYLKRIYTDLFYDYTQVWDNDDPLVAGAQREILKSTGAEFLFDLRLLRKLPMTFGIRVYERLQGRNEKLKAEGFVAASSTF